VRAFARTPAAPVPAIVSVAQAPPATCHRAAAWWHIGSSATLRFQINLVRRANSARRSAVVGSAMNAKAPAPPTPIAALRPTVATRDAASSASSARSLDPTAASCSSARGSAARTSPRAAIPKPRLARPERPAWLHELRGPGSGHALRPSSHRDRPRRAGAAHRRARRPYCCPRPGPRRLFRPFAALGAPGRAWRATGLPATGRCHHTRHPGAAGPTCRWNMLRQRRDPPRIRWRSDAATARHRSGGGLLPARNQR
jgi:hypothetical protein